ncbi:MAG: radical SAM protein [Nitrospirota bacterium]
MRVCKRKSLLYRSSAGRGDFCINHVEGCSHGCLYPCYAMLIKKKAGVISDYEDWRQPKLVENALELLEQEISRYKDRIKSVHLCFSTDPFMYGYNEVEDMSIEIIRRLNNRSITCSLLTKSVYPVERIEYLGNDNEYGITLVSLDENFRKDYEPYTARFEERIETLRYLYEKGFKTWVCMEPYSTPNIIKQDLIKILETISFVDEIVFGKLNYSPKVKAFPHAKEFYNSQAKAVINFCKRNKIKCYIKAGTITHC